MSTANRGPRASRPTMSDLKLRRCLENNSRLKDDLARPMVKISEAAGSLCRFCKTTKDPLVPSVWGPTPKGEDPYTTDKKIGCCVVS